MTVHKHTSADIKCACTVSCTFILSFLDWYGLCLFADLGHLDKLNRYNSLQDSYLSKKCTFEKNI